MHFRHIAALAALVLMSAPAAAQVEDISMGAAPVTAGQVAGTATNDNAAAGKVGEFVEATVASGSAVALVSNTPKTVMSISLTAGDWDVSGAVWYTGGATTTVTLMASGISTVTNTFPTVGKTDRVQFVFAGTTPFATQDLAQMIGPVRLSLSATTTVFLIGDLNFSVSTASAYGHIRARRVR